jgi:hypothetical protein
MCAPFPQQTAVFHEIRRIYRGDGGSDDGGEVGEVQGTGGKGEGEGERGGGGGGE